MEHAKIGRPDCGTMVSSREDARTCSHHVDSTAECNQPNLTLPGSVFRLELADHSDVERL